MVHDESASNAAKVRFPQMRRELQYAVCALSDVDFQRAVWSAAAASGHYEYPFDTAVHLLIDDSGVDRGRSVVGVVLESERELTALQTLIRAVQAIINEIGLRGTYEDAQASPGWPSVVELARVARGVLGEPPRFP